MGTLTYIVFKHSQVTYVFLFARHLWYKGCSLKIEFLIRQPGLSVNLFFKQQQLFGKVLVDSFCFFS